MARTKQPKVEPKKHTPIEEAELEVMGRDWEVSNAALRINSRLDDTEYRLRRVLDEMVRIRESDWRTLEQKAEAVAHEIAWMTPNMGLEYLVFNALVPYYDLSHLTSGLQAIGLEQDDKAWYELMGRLNHMLNLGIDLSDGGLQPRDLGGGRQHLHCHRRLLGDPCPLV